MKPDAEARALLLNTPVGLRARPGMDATISEGVEVGFDFDPDGFMGRALCICGDEEDDHEYDFRFPFGGRKGSLKNRRCHEYRPKQTKFAEAAKAIESRERPGFARNGAR